MYNFDDSEKCLVKRRKLICKLNNVLMRKSEENIKLKALENQIIKKQQPVLYEKNSPVGRKKKAG